MNWVMKKFTELWMILRVFTRNLNIFKENLIVYHNLKVINFYCT